jgi:two-component system nitrogen regulation sensor histidine kinase NtrY
MNGVTLSPMEFDREQIGRVLMNLLDNAVASLNGGGVAGGVIELALDQERGVARLVVADNGAGISDQEKPKVFEPYYSNKKGGTGLGLAIVSSIVADHQGSIRIEDREGGGVRFIVELPLGVQQVLKRV